MIGAVMRCVASGNTFASLGEEFHIGGSTLHSFDSKFWNWFRNFNAVQDHKEYWSTWVGGVSGVGFDDIVSIQHEEKLFTRQTFRVLAARSVTLTFAMPLTLSCPGLHCGTISLVTLCIFLVTISLVNF
jgi:hypothetical protein